MKGSLYTKKLTYICKNEKHKEKTAEWHTFPCQLHFRHFGVCLVSLPICALNAPWTCRLYREKEKDFWHREARTQSVGEKGSGTEEARHSDKGSEAGREKRERKVVKQWGWRSEIWRGEDTAEWSEETYRDIQSGGKTQRLWVPQESNGLFCIFS